MNASQPAASKSDVSLEDVVVLLFGLVKDASFATDKLLSAIDALREEREATREQQAASILIIRQTQIEQCKLSILAELSRRDLEDDLARTRKLEREYQVFRKASGQ